MDGWINELNWCYLSQVWIVSPVMQSERASASLGFKYPEQKRKKSEVDFYLGTLKMKYYYL